MKKTALLLYSLALFVALPGTYAMAHDKYAVDINTSCGYDVVALDDCVFCHDGTKNLTPNQITYQTDGACAFCPEVTSCNAAPPTELQLLEDAQNTTTAYNEDLFKRFTTHLMAAGGDFAAVFPDCPDIAPIAGSFWSRETGYLVRRVSTRTRNSRNIPDDWELEQLLKFDEMAANGDPRTEFIITKPDGINFLKPKEYEAYEVTSEGSGQDRKYFFRYMRSLTMPPHPKDPNVPAEKNPGLPCLACHGTPGVTYEMADGSVIPELAPGVLEAARFLYPYDKAMGYSMGDIRGAWTIKIPLADKPK